MTGKVRIIAVRILVLIALLLSSATDVNAAKIPAGAKIELFADRGSFFVGENILLHYRITNEGKDSFGFNVGADYRGGNRARRFKVVARDGPGRIADDPYPIQHAMGGGMGGTRLKPGEVWYEGFLLPRYCRLDKPGRYQIEAYHDLGWGERVENDPRVQTCGLTLREPDEAAAKTIVANMRKLFIHPDRSWGEKRMPSSDPTLLTHPIYLPHLERGDDVKGMIAIAHMDSEAATQALLRLMASKNAVVASGAAWAVAHRVPQGRASLVPDVSFGYPLHRRPEVYGWDRSFDVLARREARVLLERTNVRTIIASAGVLAQLGDTNDLPHLIVKLDEIFDRMDPAIINAMPVHGPKRNQYLMLKRALWQGQEILEQFARRGIVFSGKPISNAEYLAFVARSLVEKSMGKTFVAALKHRHPIIRETAVRRVRGRISGDLAEAVIALLGDPDLYVRFRAGEAVNNSMPTSPFHPDKRPFAMSRELWIRVLGEDLESLSLDFPY